jgi:hypothetical protein
VSEADRRRARNEATFRDANERLGDRARAWGMEGVVPFLCECDDPRCTEIVRLTLQEYEQVRAGPARFLVRPEHAGHPAEQLVENADRYAVVEKRGPAAAYAKALDPRS